MYDFKQVGGKNSSTYFRSYKIRERDVELGPFNMSDEDLELGELFSRQDLQAMAPIGNNREPDLVPLAPERVPLAPERVPLAPEREEPPPPPPPSELIVKISSPKLPEDAVSSFFNGCLSRLDQISKKFSPYIPTQFEQYIPEPLADSAIRVSNLAERISNQITSYASARYLIFGTSIRPTQAKFFIGSLDESQALNQGMEAIGKEPLQYTEASQILEGMQNIGGFDASVHHPVASQYKIPVTTYSPPQSNLERGLEFITREVPAAATRAATYVKDAPMRIVSKINNPTSQIIDVVNENGKALTDTLKVITEPLGKAFNELGKLINAAKTVAIPITLIIAGFSVYSRAADRRKASIQQDPWRGWQMGIGLLVATAGLGGGVYQVVKNYLFPKKNRERREL